jgi:hypothetical protein
VTVGRVQSYGSILAALPLSLFRAVRWTSINHKIFANSEIKDKVK